MFLLRFNWTNFLDEALPLNLVIRNIKKNMPLTRGEGYLMGAQVAVSSSLGIFVMVLVMVHETGSITFFLLGSLARRICLFESNMKTQKI